MRSSWRWKFSIALVSIVILAALTWQFMPKTDAPIPQDSKKQPTPRAQTVSVTYISRADVPIWRYALGSVNPLQQVTVRSRIDGELMALHFQEGDWVKKGQKLASIDPRPLQVELSQQQAQEKRDLALLNNAQVDLKRYQQLVKEEAISSQQIDTQQALVKQYEANLAGTRALIATTQLQLSYCHIHAPIAGKLGFRKIDVGNYIHANDTEGLVHILQLDPIAVIFSLPEQQAVTLYHAMQNNQMTWQLEAWQRDAPTPVVTGQITSVENQIDATTGTLKFKAVFNNAQHILIPNQVIQVRFKEKTLSQVMTLPKAAVLKSEKGHFIYQIQAENRVIQQAVKLLDSTEDLSIIAWERPEDQPDESLPVVLEGADKLRTGSVVKYHKSTDLIKPSNTTEMTH